MRKSCNLTNDTLKKQEEQELKNRQDVYQQGNHNPTITKEMYFDYAYNAWLKQKKEEWIEFERINKQKDDAKKILEKTGKDMSQLVYKGNATDDTIFDQLDEDLKQKTHSIKFNKIIEEQLSRLKESNPNEFNNNNNNNDKERLSYLSKIYEESQKIWKDVNRTQTSFINLFKNLKLMERSY